MIDKDEMLLWLWQIITLHEQMEQCGQAHEGMELCYQGNIQFFRGLQNVAFTMGLTLHVFPNCYERGVDKLLVNFEGVNLIQVGW